MENHTRRHLSCGALRFAPCALRFAPCALRFALWAAVLLGLSLFPAAMNAGAERFVVCDPAEIEDAALLDGEFATWNFGGSPLLEAGFMGGIYAEHRAVSLIRFDVSGVGCARVDEATLRLYKPKSFVQTREVRLHVAALRPENSVWKEGTAYGAPDPAGAGWSRPHLQQRWKGSPGCAEPNVDYEAASVASLTVALDRGEWLEFSLSTNLVQAWLDDPTKNAGVRIWVENHDSEWGEHVYLCSSEHFSGKGPQLVIEGSAGPAARGTNGPVRAKTAWRLPALDSPAFEGWLKKNGRLARMTKDCKMSPDQALLFYFYDTQAREEFLLPRYQRALARAFDGLNQAIAEGNEGLVGERLREVRQGLLTWEYLRETCWYTAGVNAEYLSPWQLGQLFSRSIFGRLEDAYDLARQTGEADSGTWQPLSGEALERMVADTVQFTARKLEMNERQVSEIAPRLEFIEREEQRYVAAFRKHLDRARQLAREGQDNSDMMAAVRGMHLNHERFLYFQSIYDTPRWQLFTTSTPILPFAKWAAEVGKRYYPKPRPAAVRTLAKKARRTAHDILPPGALAAATDHPLDARIQTFIREQPNASISATGLSSDDYLRILNVQAACFRRCQDTNGAIIDPVMGIEWQYSTPCYALTVALLHLSGHNLDPGLLESGLRAMDSSVSQISQYRCAHNHGEFYLQPVLLALDLYSLVVPESRSEAWRASLAPVDPYKLHPDNLKRKTKVYNHNVVALAGEFLRLKSDLAADTNFFHTHLSNQKQYLNSLGMYLDPNVPMVYDEFSRQFLASILCEGYEGPERDFYREHLWRGAWTSLFMQSPFGECPTGGRSAQHIWNEAQMAVTYEIYATQHARRAPDVGAMQIAGAFKRAAHLSLASIERWLRPDGSGYVVKNRYPIEARHGYERYSAQSQYNLLACWLLAVAWLYADDAIPEAPAPADVGGFVISIPDFYKVFANCRGNYLEYDTAGDLRYNPTGILRVHLRGSNPQLGPSDGVVHRFDPRTKADLGGENLAVGPAWQDGSGAWHRLADFSSTNLPTVEILRETPTNTTFTVVYRGDLMGPKAIAQTITVSESGVRIQDKLEGVSGFRVCYPMLVFDGLEHTRIALSEDSATLEARDGAVRFSLLHPKSARLFRAGYSLPFRNGQAEALFADIPGSSAIYEVRTAPFPSRR